MTDGGILGAHAILYSADADATREALGELLGTRSVDAGGGWLIFAPRPKSPSIPTRAAAATSSTSCAMTCGRRSPGSAGTASNAVRSATRVGVS